MRPNAKKMWSVLVLSAVSGVAGAQWQEGEFSGDLNWQGTVTQSRNPWVWAQGALTAPVELDLTQSQSRDGRIEWRNLLTQTPLLLGKTEQLVPQGRPGILPTIQYGHDVAGMELLWTNRGEAQLTLPVQGGDGSRRGELSVMLRINAGLVSTHAGVRQGFSLAAGADEPGNGLPPAGFALPTDQILPALRTLFGPHAPAWLASEVAMGGETTLATLTNPAHHAIGGLYGAEIVAGSGILSFAKGTLPEQWQVQLPIQITYR